MIYANRTFAVTSLLTAMLALPAHADAEFFVAPYAGYSIGGSNSFDINQLDASQVETGEQQSVGVEDSEHYGLLLGIGTIDPGNIYLLFSRQSSELKSGGLYNPDLITDLTVDYIHIGGTLYFPQGDFQPYITSSLGVTRMIPDGWSTETRFSMGIGGGAEYRLSQQFSLFGDVRGHATFVDSESSLFCHENQCLWHVTSDLMWQVQANLGFKFSF